MQRVDIIGDVEEEMRVLKDFKLNELADELVEMIGHNNDANIYVYGAGRSGFIGKSFSMRLVQLGLNMLLGNQHPLSCQIGILWY